MTTRSAALRRSVALLLLLGGSTLGSVPALAQNPVYLEGPQYAAVPYEDLSHAWVANIGEQLRASLYARSDEIRFRAIQEVVTLSDLYPGRLDLTPTVQPLLQIYATSGDERHRMAAVNALSAVGDDRGMAELNDLSYEDPRSPAVRRTAQNAVKLHFATRSMQRHEAQAQRYLAQGKVKKAERHTRRAAWYRSRTS